MKTNYSKWTIFFLIPLLFCLNSLSALFWSKEEAGEQYGVEWKKATMETDTTGVTATIPGKSYFGIGDDMYFISSHFEGGACEIRFPREKHEPFESLEECLKLYKEILGAHVSVASVKVKSPHVMYAIAVEFPKKLGELPHRVLIYHTKNSMYQIHYIGENKKIQRKYFESVEVTKS